MSLINRKRTPTILKIKEEFMCLIGIHKHCVKHYDLRKNKTIQYVYCQSSGKLIKKIHIEDSPLKTTYDK